MQSTKNITFNLKLFIFLISLIIGFIILDTVLIKITDNVYKYFIPITEKILFFGIFSFLCLFVQFILLTYFKKFFKEKTKLSINKFFFIFMVGFVINCILIGYIVQQMLFLNYYSKILLIIITLLNYFIALVFIVKLFMIFISWFNLRHNLIVLLYFIAIGLIITSLVVNSLHSSLKIYDRPDYIREYLGGVIDISISKYRILDNIYKISASMSFIFIWLASLLLLNNYRANPWRTLVLWIVISLPVVYFFVIELNLILSPLLYSLDLDPIYLLIIIIILNSISQPIGALNFGILFWNIARIVDFDYDLKSFLIISGIGILLIFGSNQANNLILTSYPPFGLATITFLPIGTFLTLIGIYNSAIRVSANVAVRRFLYASPFESKLLDILGKAETQKELQFTVSKIVSKHNLLETPEKNFELDEKQLNEYLEDIYKELNKNKFRT